MGGPNCIIFAPFAKPILQNPQRNLPILSGHSLGDEKSNLAALLNAGFCEHKDRSLIYTAHQSRSFENHLYLAVGFIDSIRFSNVHNVLQQLFSTGTVEKIKNNFLDDVVCKTPSGYR